MTQTDGKMKTIESNGKKLMLVEVPIEACRIHLNDFNGRLFVGFNNSKGFGYGETEVENANIHECNILGTIENGVIDFDVSGIVEAKYNDIYKFFKNYSQDYDPSKYVFSNPQDSFLSLLKKSGIEVKDKKFVVVKELT